MVFRVYVEKKPGFDVAAQQLANELRTILGIEALKNVRLVNRYDVEGISEELFAQATPTVFSEPQVDNVYADLPDFGSDTVFAVEYLPGQFDQRADSASECIQLISQGERPTVRSAKVYALEGELSEADVEAIKHYVINPVEAREASLDVKTTLKTQVPVPGKVEVIDGFRSMSDAELEQFIEDRGLAMDLADLQFCREHFTEEQRDPTITEIKVIDTYWSDHCRHTTFGTQLDDVQIDDAAVQAAFDKYLEMRHELGRDAKPVCLMDMGTIGAKWLKKNGILKNLDESEEINACTVKVKVDVNGHDEDWLFLFKNETHNHPTEIEPFGGAATCIGGCIRDPLSGRSYVYQAMRVTGAADPTVPVSETLEGKLPQRKLVTTAAAGYSSYGNQIGLATGQVDEIYHPGYVAKRMEVGAVVAATPADHVRRETPAPGDKVILLGGRTGRDGIGGATGASKAHNVESLELDGAEVQKGNAPVERKLQRLFRRGDACRLIKRCNDFGAGGVSVAVGELADGLYVDLNKVSKKYEGLDGTELAISESQERMAVDVAAEDVDEFLGYAKEENLEAEVIATVTEDPRMTMVWNGDTIVDLSREFLASNGAPKHQVVHVEAQHGYTTPWASGTLSERMHTMLTDLNVASNKGLSERFDSTIGAGTVLMPFGGRKQLTPNMAMVAKLPVFGETTTASAMAWGFNPYIMEQNQFTGAYLSVVESLSKLVAAGFEHEKAYLSFQEYFEKLRDEPERWGKPMAAVLGALMAQVDLGAGAIGGKDSMSGTFEKMDVPPTLCSFAIAPGKASEVISPEFKEAGHAIRLVSCDPHDTAALTANYDAVLSAIRAGKVVSAWALGLGGVAEGLFKMGIGNQIGTRIDDDYDGNLFAQQIGAMLLECTEDIDLGVKVGDTVPEWVLEYEGERIDLTAMQEIYEGKLDKVFSYRGHTGETTEKFSYSAETYPVPAVKTVKPLAFIPVFPGTNCEYDTARAVERAGGAAEILVINNLTPEAITQSIAEASRMIARSQMIVLPGGFSGGDEPDGSAKFITAFFRNPAMKDAVYDLLQRRDGLMLGICNGFQALIKLGLVPYGEIIDTSDQCPTLTFNEIGRHQSMLVRTRIASNKSPWLSRCKVDDIHTVAISHGEGRFVGPEALIRQLAANGQIATQYVDLSGAPSMDMRFNPNASYFAIEGITSPDGRVLGKMGHTERSGENLYKNVPGDKYQPLFEGGVDYFRL